MPEKRAYLGLDLIRFLAATLVMLFHFGFAGWALPKAAAEYSLRSAFRPLQGPLSTGWVGVQVFFVLSGFVIAFSASEKGARDFVIGRCARLYPAAWICATATFLITHKPLGDYLRGMVLSPIGPWVSGVYWTLAVEISFYAMVAILLATVGSQQLKAFGAALGLFSSLFWLARLVDAATGGHFRWLGAELVTDPWANAALLTNGCYFGLGVMLWTVARNGWTKATAAVAGICVVAGVLAIGATSKHFAENAANLPSARFGPPLIWLFAIALIYGAIRYNEALWCHFSRHAAAIRLIGLATYPLYLLHYDIGCAIMAATHMIGAWPSLGLATATMLAAAFLVVKLERYPRALIFWAAGVKRTAAPAASLP